jgi:hypothetical protein
MRGFPFPIRNRAATGSGYYDISAAERQQQRATPVVQLFEAEAKLKMEAESGFT